MKDYKQNWLFRPAKINFSPYPAQRDAAQRAFSGGQEGGEKDGRRENTQ